MGTELMRSCLQEEEMDFQAIPPGFGPLASFTLKRIDDSEKINTSEALSVEVDPGLDKIDAAKTRCLRRRSSVNYSTHDCNSGDESDFDKNYEKVTVRPCLPKGVIRGCAECINCQKVTARWRPEDARRHELEDAPVFYPTEEEFEDTINYIASIRPKAEPYGICRIVPPPSWKPPCPLKETNLWQNSKFATRIQKVDKLQNRDSIKKKLSNNNHMKRKKRKCMRMGVECGTGGGDILNLSGAGSNEAEIFGFEPGPEFTLDAFREYAQYFKSQYFSKTAAVANTCSTTTSNEEQKEPSIEDIEGEYWRVVENPTEEIEVLYGADLETGTFGSGFPKMSDEDFSTFEERYIKSGWNLNNFPRLQGSVLSFESGDISGVLIPWLYIGMCFSSFCWHVEDHHLYSMNYMHWGEPKLWYGVSSTDSVKMEEVMRNHLPELFEEQPDLLHKLVTQLSPSILKSEGVPVYRCVQTSGEFVLTFPRAYHSGFNSGFNCAEAVNVAPVDWLPHGQNAIELYSEQARRTSISHDKLLLGAAREAVRAHWELNLLRKHTSDNLRWKSVCGKDGILVKSLKARVEMERSRRQSLPTTLQTIKMDSNFDATDERECHICLFDLHLSAAVCHCSPDKYSCLNHAKQLCTCSWASKIFLYRYDIDELNILVDALEGKLSAIYRWARLDLGLALSSFVSKDKTSVPTHASKIAPEGIIQKQNIPFSSESQLNMMKVKKEFKVIPISSSNENGEISSSKQEKPSGTVPGVEDAHSFSRFQKTLPKKNDLVLSASNTGVSAVCQLSQENASYSEGLSAAQPEVRKPSSLKDVNIICLSDDEGEKPIKSSKETYASCVDRAMVVSSVLQSDIPVRLTYFDENTSLCNYKKDLVLAARTTNAAVISKGDANVLAKNETNTHHSQTGCAKNEGQGEKDCGSDPPSSCKASGNVGVYTSYSHSPTKTDDANSSMENSGNHLQLSQPSSSGRFHTEDRVGRVSTGNQCTQNNLDRYFREKGPRIAKVVRRISCNVEPLEYGTVHSEKLWCNSQAIFPKGYRSRVKYISVLDPAESCSYISEILDGGRVGPLFMVSLESCSKEVFVHVSMAKCWEMVRERVNQEISRQHKLGRMKLPPLQPPGSLDGHEMFGFSSPTILQAIEAMDHTRVCTEYWNSRPYSRFQLQVPEQPQPKINGTISQTDEHSRRIGRSSRRLPAGGYKVLEGLLKKANPKEMKLLYSVLVSDDKPVTDPREIHSEIQKNPTR